MRKGCSRYYFCLCVTFSSSILLRFKLQFLLQCKGGSDLKEFFSIFGPVSKKKYGRTNVSLIGHAHFTAEQTLSTAG